MLHQPMAWAEAAVRQELAPFLQDLQAALAEHGHASLQCAPAREIAAEDLKALKRLQLTPDAYSTALVWLFHDAQRRCLDAANRRLALAIVRYRQAARAGGVPTTPADAAEELVWGSVAAEARIRFAWEALPEAVRARLLALPSLRRPFAPVSVLRQLQGDSNP